MPRRKQHAPRRAAAYDTDDIVKPALGNEAPGTMDSLSEGKPHSNADSSETGPLLEDSKDESSAEHSGHELDSESHASESSDPMSDLESSSIQTDGNAFRDVLKDSCLDSASAPSMLEQMKAIYTSFLSNSSWSSLNLDLTQACTERLPQGRANASIRSSSSSSTGAKGFDWHQSAVAKTLQQVSQKQHQLALEPSIFSTVQLYRQSARLYSSIFTGASKFRCKSCSAAYDTLVDLTVHMNETGHYRDDNQQRGGKGARHWSKPRKRSLLEMEGKDDAQKVLRCMYCGHSFESLQDLSVHMIKTKHYQKVPLKEPVPSMSTKVIPSSRKKLSLEVDVANSLCTEHTSEMTNPSGATPKNPAQLTQKDRTSFDLTLDSHNSQILTCLVCGIPHDSLQELTAHLMLTGHFVRVANPESKDIELFSGPQPSPTRTAPAEEKTQSVSSGWSSLPPRESVESSSRLSPTDMDMRSEMHEEKDVQDDDCEKDSKEVVESFCRSNSDYLSEGDLKENPKGGLDILKSLENTVTSAINKAQNSVPSWGGYPSIHAAYQLPSKVKVAQGTLTKLSHLKQGAHDSEGSSVRKAQPQFSSNDKQNSPSSKASLHDMEELVKNVTEKVAKVKEQMREIEESTSQAANNRQQTTSPCSSDDEKSLAANCPRAQTPLTLTINRSNHSDCDSVCDEMVNRRIQNSSTPSPPSLPALTSATTAPTPLPDPNQPLVDPLSALQSVMNQHLGQAAQPVVPAQDPMSMLMRLSCSMVPKVPVPSLPKQSKTPAEQPLDLPTYQTDKDQPIDLSKGRNKPSFECSASPSALPYSSLTVINSPDPTSSQLQENALSDISDMLRNLTDAHTLKPSTPALVREQPDNTDDVSLVHKRKGRQSQWNPQHLLVLQAQFTSSLRKTAEGKYVIADLSPQERMVISQITGLSLTTISHWLANVKYQLRRSGRTKFLKHMDSGSPVFFCSECASQIQTRSSYVCHLESHLGFRLRDFAKVTAETIGKKIAKSSKTFSKKGGNKEQFRPLKAL